MPDFLLVPLLAFDRAAAPAGLWRRLLRPHPGRAAAGAASRWAAAFAAQEVDAVPAGRTTCALDAVATERGMIRCEEN